MSSGKTLLDQWVKIKVHSINLAHSRIVKSSRNYHSYVDRWGQQMM